MTVSGLILHPGEHGAFSCGATYDRWYGQDVTYTQTSFMAFGSKSALVGSLAGSALWNSSRRRKAARMSAQQWRDIQDTSVIATDRRLLVSTREHGWLSFYYEGVAEFYPEPFNWSMTMVWPDVPPLRLRGLAVPYLSVHAAAIIYGTDWVRQPSLGPLLPT